MQGKHFNSESEVRAYYAGQRDMAELQAFIVDGVVKLRTGEPLEGLIEILILEEMHAIDQLRKRCHSLDKKVRLL